VEGRRGEESRAERVETGVNLTTNKFGSIFVVSSKVSGQEALLKRLY
jgi:hypothetical protein